VDSRALSILWFDSLGGLVAGAAVLLVRSWLASLYGLSADLVLVIACANLAYGTYSGTLAALAARGRSIARPAIDLLVLANLAWTLVCIALIAHTLPTATVFGLAHLALEGLWVGALGIVEYRRVRPLSH
jgi:hypothetical protein